MTRAFIASLVLLSAARASADDTPPSSGNEPGALELSLKAGGHFPGITNSLKTSFDGVLKVGYGVALDQRLQIFADLGYSQPSHKVSDSDGRLSEGGDSFTSTMRVRDLSTLVGVQFFIPLDVPMLLPYVGAGAQLHFIRAVVEGETKPSFGRNEETATRVGGAVFGGMGLRLGPGLLLGEVRFGYATVSEKVTGTSNIGALSLLLGYGLML